MSKSATLGNTIYKEYHNFKSGIDIKISVSTINMMLERICTHCIRGEKIKDGDQYQTPDGSLMVRTSGDGIFRSCIESADKKHIEALITTDTEPECIFPDRFISTTSETTNI